MYLPVFLLDMINIVPVKKDTYGFKCRLCIFGSDGGRKETRAGIFKRVWGPGIDSKEWIPPAYVAWRAGTITLFLPGS